MGERELADIRRRLAEPQQRHRHLISGCPECERQEAARQDASALLAAIDERDRMIDILRTDEDAYPRGVQCERGRVLEFVKGVLSHWRIRREVTAGGGAGAAEAVVGILEVLVTVVENRDAGPGMLPPVAARARADGFEKALREIADARFSDRRMSPEGLDYLRDIAQNALEESP
jgi:hypothetical protein